MAKHQTRKPRRILAYTHNAIGLGHAVRTMAVIDGIRAARPDVDWLVISGTSVPQVFLNEGVEIVKLPGIRQAPEIPGQPYHPRLLNSLDRDEVSAWRRRIIDECLRSFRPEAIIVEHSLAGLMGEAMPLLAAKAANVPGALALTLVHLSRGIYRYSPQPLSPPDDYPDLPPKTNILGLYDAFYVLDDRKVVDVNREFFGNDPAIEGRIRYLGRIAMRNADEIARLKDLPGELLTRGKPFILISLGRHGRVADLHIRLLVACRNMGLGENQNILVVADPYLNSEILAGIKKHPAAQGIRFTSFVPHLVEVMAKADLVICRAGYNTVNEVLLTGVKALVIPEPHPSGEQERRSAAIPRDNVLVMDEDEFLSGEIKAHLLALLERPLCPYPVDFDRFRIGRIIAAELERFCERKAAG